MSTNIPPCHRLSRSWIWLASIALLMLIIPFPSHAQTTTSSIFGVITDPTGAVIPNAHVTAKNTQTGISYPATTDANGAFRISQLPPANYTLQVTATGFSTKITTPFTLFVDQASQQNLSLATGMATQTVSVSAASLLINTESSSEGQIIENQQIEQLPLNGRDFMQLTALSAGVTPVVAGISSPAGQWTTGNSSAAGETVSVDIGGLREDDVSYLNDGIETRNAWYGAEGLVPSIDDIQEFRIAQIGSSAAYGDAASFLNLVTRSGTDTFHGTAYEFLRNNDFDARNWFDVGAPPPFHQNQFGASFGGPAIKNKLFFFFNYEGFRLIQPNDLNELVPTAAERAGDFSAVATQLYNPYTNAPYIGNQIPAGSAPGDQNSIGIKTLSFFPLPNGSFPGNTNYHTVSDTINNWNQETGRIDWNPSGRDSLFARIILQSQAQTTEGFTPYNTDVYPSDPRNLAVGWTHTFSPHLVNTFRWGWSHTSTGENRGDGDTPSLANPLGLLNEEDQPGSDGPPSFGISGYPNPGSPQGTNIMREGMIMTTDNVMMQRGKQQLSAGLDIRYEPTYFYEDWAASSVDFNGTYTGNSIADVLVGVPDYAQTAFGNPTLNMRRWYQGYYVQDDWRARQNLTINAGLRWDHHTQPVDTANHVGTFDLATGQDLTYPQTSAVGLGRKMVRPDWTDWEPRIGFNWVPLSNGKTDVKGGAGVYFTQANMNQYEVEVDTTQYYLVDAFSNSPACTPGNGVSTYCSANGGAYRAPSYGYNNLFSQTTPGAAPTASFINPNNRDPYVYEFNLAIDHTIADWLFEVSYIGTLSRRFEVRSNLNPVQPSGQTLDPAWNGIQENLDAGNSAYNGIFGRIERRFKNGFSMTAAYTFSKCFSDPWQDTFDWHPLHLQSDWGHCSYSLDQVFTGNAVYRLPFGRGQMFMNHGGWTDEVLGGWELSGIASAHTGAWVTLGGVQNLGLFVNSLPNVTGPVNNTSRFSGLGKHGKLGPIFNTQNVTRETATGVQGNAGVQNIATPGWQNYDVSADKTWKFPRNLGLTFRGDFFNVFNHPQFINVDTGVADTTFGQVTAANAAREIQLSLRLAF